ncbi:MAG: cytochrome c maturation protein CcmE [Deltaproteobacteria bacterium]|nr:cytochrome c maturation protein CcmE [Deltaproteobacteria bacterium]
MNKKINYGVGFLIIAIALGYLVATSFSSSLQYYITVSEALTDQGRLYHDKIIKIAGKAKNISRTEKQNKSVYAFDIAEGDKTIHVTYDGLTPDSFREDSDVVVTGSLDADGHFKATHILAKCSSKYQAKTTGHSKEK